MNLEKVEAVLSSIAELLDTDEGASEEVLAALVNELYESIVSKYRPVVRAIPHVADKVAADITPVAVAILKLLNSVSADPALQEEMERSNKLKSERRFKVLKAYQEVSFTRPEAMSLLLADVASFKENRSQVSRSARPSSKD